MRFYALSEVLYMKQRPSLPIKAASLIQRGGGHTRLDENDALKQAEHIHCVDTMLSF